MGSETPQKALACKLAALLAVTALCCVSGVFICGKRGEEAMFCCEGVVVSVASAKEVLPPNTANFLAGRWHPAPECVQCHVSLLTKDELNAKLGSCNCHSAAYSTAGNLDMEKIREKAHGIKVCVDCHIGTGLADPKNISCGKFHRAHQGARCEACHIQEGSREPFVPESTSCDACHSRDPHAAHGAKTTELCVVCHGEFGEKYKEAGVLPPEIGGEAREQGETAKAPFPTISELFKNVFGELMSIFGF